MPPRDAELQPLVPKGDEPEDEITPKISEWQAGASFAKVIMGAGSFALPWAFMKIGFVAGPIFLIGLVLISVPTLELLTRISKRMDCTTSYFDVAHAVFGPIGSRLTYAASVFASVGVCGSYLIFCASNLKGLFFGKAYTDAEEDTGLQSMMVLAILPVAILLSAAKDMKNSAWISLLGDVSVILGMLAVIAYGMMEMKSSTRTNDAVPVGNIEEMPIALGTIGYLFLVHMTAPPIYSAMERPENIGKVAWWTFLTCAVISGVFGVLGYLAFGSDTQQIVLGNLGRGSGSFSLVSAVQILLCIDLMLTYPIVMRPSIIIVEQNWNVGRLAVSTLLGVVAAGASLLIPAFAALSGLVGGVSLSFLALVMPPLMHWKFSASEGRLSVVREIPTVVAFVVGIILMVWTLYSTLRG